MVLPVADVVALRVRVLFETALPPVPPVPLFVAPPAPPVAFWLRLKLPADEGLEALSINAFPPFPAVPPLELVPPALASGDCADVDCSATDGTSRHGADRAICAIARIRAVGIGSAGAASGDCADVDCPATERNPRYGADRAICAIAGTRVVVTARTITAGGVGADEDCAAAGGTSDDGASGGGSAVSAVEASAVSATAAGAVGGAPRPRCLGRHCCRSRWPAHFLRCFHCRGQWG